MRGIAVTSLVMLILGMIVVAVLGYLVYRTFVGGAGKTFSSEECKAKLIAACTNCINFNACPSVAPSGCNPADFGLNWNSNADALKSSCRTWMGQ